MFFCNNNKNIEKSTPGVPLRKLVILVKEAGYLLGQLGANTASTPSVKSRSVLKSKLAVYEMKAYSTKSYIDIILADITKVEKNLTPTENKYSVK